MVRDYDSRMIQAHLVYSLVGKAPGDGKKIVGRVENAALFSP